MTMHAAKGREFEVVFVAGVEAGLVPLELAEMRSDRDEERRLLYVAITGARRLAVLSHAGKRVLFGQRLPGEPSPFLAGLPRAALLEHQVGLPARRDARQLRLLYY